jgi:FtsZ-binding cell division protein ZapB
MDITYLNIVTFVFITIGYYLALKPPLTVNTLANQTAYSDYKKQSYFRLVGYFIFVVLFQFFINTSSIVSRCGGSFTKNIGSSAFWTFIPWTFIFGVVIMVLIVFPGFKSAFSNIVGYYYIAGRANQILAELLVDVNAETAIDKSFGNTGEVGEDGELKVNGSTKEEYQEIQQALLSLAGNMSILVNKIVPSNFIQFWNLLLPLMKSKFRNPLSAGDLNQKQTELLQLVVAKDDIGEAFWYGYTAVLLITMIQYYINTLDCNKSVDQMQQEYQTFLQKEKQELQKKNTAVKVDYKSTQ